MTIIRDNKRCSEPGVFLHVSVEKRLIMSYPAISPHLSLLVLCEQSAVEVLQCQLGHGHPLSGVVAHGKGSCSPSRHGHTILLDKIHTSGCAHQSSHCLY